MPGAGKSTTAHLLALHMRRNGQPAAWHYEHESPHPIFHYPDILAIIEEGRLNNGLFEDAIVRWRGLVDEMRATGTSRVLESAFFQIPVHPMRLLGWSDERIADYVTTVAAILRPVSPLIVLLRHEDVAAALRNACAWRGEWFASFLESGIARSAWGQTHGCTGFDGVVNYFTGYRDLLDRLLFHVQIPVLILDATDGRKAAAGDAIAAALGLPPIDDFPTPVPLEVYIGKYIAVGSDSVFDIVSDGRHLYVHDLIDTRLIHVEDHAFELAGTPLRLEFVAGSADRMASIDCTGALPNLARQWVRTE